jgi:hypothetical protein
MPEKWVVNASPLIVLARINHLILLQRLAEEIVVPAGVAKEIAQGLGDDPAREWLKSHGQDLVRKVEVVPPVIIAWNLGLGESEVLAWAYQNAGYEAVLDDRAARNCALYWVSYRLPGGKQRREFVGNDPDGQPLGIEEAKAAEGKRRAEKKENPSILKKVPAERMAFSELIDWYLNLKDSFKKACQWAGIAHGRDVPDGLIFHDLRRTVKTNMVNASVDQVPGYHLRP